MLEYKEKLYLESLIKWGIGVQKGMFIEEIGETLTALNKINRISNGCTIDELLNEFADMQLLLEEMIFFYNVDNKFKEIKDLKLKQPEVCLMDM